MNVDAASRWYHRLLAGPLRGEGAHPWGLAWPDARRVLALLARDGALPVLDPALLGLPEGRLHEALGHFWNSVLARWPELKSPLAEAQRAWLEGTGKGETGAPRNP